MRLVSKGNLCTLKEQMEAADPSLQSWMTYLTAACRYLHKRGYHHLLYDLQVFMKVSYMLLIKKENAWFIQPSHFCYLHVDFQLF
jgi:hypothetical protein